MTIKKYFIILVMTLFISFCLLAIQNVSAVSPPEAVGHWKFDEGIGSYPFDETTNNNDGTLSGGKFGNALEFDGFDDYVNIPDDTSLDITADITLEAWINIRKDYINRFQIG